MRTPLVYIHSASHSGSTLLALQLARHPEVATVGELSGTVHRAKPGYKCSCGLALADCDFWRRVSEAMARRGFAYTAATAETDIRNTRNPFARRLLKPLHRGPLLEGVRDAGLALAPGCRAHLARQAELKAALAQSVVECAGKPVLVDSSKSGVQLKYHLRNPALDVKAICLVRDGRGVALSIVRNQGASLPEGAWQWRRTNEEAREIMRALPGSRWIHLRYEELCADPEGTLQQLWNFIGVSPGKPQTPELHVLGHASRLKGVAPIRNQEKWRTDLPAADLRTFEAIGGRLNRELGYA